IGAETTSVQEGGKVALFEFERLCEGESLHGQAIQIQWEEEEEDECREAEGQLEESEDGRRVFGVLISLDQSRCEGDGGDGEDDEVIFVIVGVVVGVALLVVIVAALGIIGVVMWRKLREKSVRSQDHIEF